MTIEIVTARLNERFGDVIRITSDYDEVCLHTAKEHILDVVSFLKTDPDCLFTQLIDLCGVDYPERPSRFELAYHFLSMRKNLRLRVKMSCAENEIVPSLMAVHVSADWFEREAFDMYGILFSDHPDLRRILTDYHFSGYPLRKDFPVTGFVELRYDEAEKRAVYEPVNLTQDFRNFEFESPWEGDGAQAFSQELREKMKVV
jgi:NADH-quinone oxidoreductase subunit C